MKFLEYCKKKGIRPSVKAYLYDAMGSMALGLFASLLIGTIFNALGMIPHLGFFARIGAFCTEKHVVGAAMAVAIAYALKAPPLVMLSAAAVGAAANDLGAGGGPLAVFLVTIIAVELGKLVSKATQVDILVTPLTTIFAGAGLSLLVAPPIGTLVGFIQQFLGWATERVPLVMGIIVAVVIGMALTLPISSAAICAAFFTAANASANPRGLALAAGAAIAGCCAQMVGFAVMSFKENRWNGLLSQGLGTSMLQMPNIVKNPLIWLPPIIASAVTGPLATCVFDLEMYGACVYAGMGTCGLLGPIGLILGWFGETSGQTPGVLQWIGLALVCFILPAGICLGLGFLFRKLRWIREDDLKLEL